MRHHFDNIDDSVLATISAIDCITTRHQKFDVRNIPKHSRITSAGLPVSFENDQSGSKLAMFPILLLEKLFI